MALSRADGCCICGKKRYKYTSFCYEHYLENEKEWEYNNECIICGEKIRGIFTFCKKCHQDIEDMSIVYHEERNIEELLPLYNSLRFDLLNRKFNHDILIEKVKHLCAISSNLQEYDTYGLYEKKLLHDVRRIFVYDKFRNDSDSDSNKMCGAKYRAKQSSLSEPEIKFLRKLERVIDKNKYYIDSQKSLRQMIDKMIDGNAYELNRDIDFVIVDRFNRKNVLLIEYNDSTHNFKDRKKRDSEIKRICDEAGLKLIFIKRDDDMSLDYLRGRLEDLL